ncbi:MAG: ATP phosphoribosyltransferase regulatory subunit [Chloroflexi bacterium]|nr:ATP phosphoribosyltransferase regulatory subunit [Chloroflexota bacterium]
MTQSLEKRGQEASLKCRGCYDMQPGEMAQFRHIEDVFRDSCLKWGYQEVKTPTLEYMHLFTSTGTLTMGKLSRVYSFLDWDGWSGERVVLRPDCTIPVARMYIEGKAGRSDPAKLFYVMNVFAFEDSGRESREKWQCGAEFLGGSGPLADAELMSLAVNALGAMGVKGARLRLSHVGVLRELLKGLASGEDDQREMLDQILDGNCEALARIKNNEGELGKLVSLLVDHTSSSASLLKNCRSMCGANLAALGKALDDFVAVAELLDSVGCPYEIDMGSARGFEYYTGVTFQVFCGASNVGAGGRYDALIPLMEGGDVPASGFGLYMDRMLSLVQAGAGVQSPWKGILIETAHTPGAVKASFDIARVLRDGGFVADLGLPGQRTNLWSWKLAVEPNAYVLTGPDGMKSEVASPLEVLRLVGGR